MTQHHTCDKFDELFCLTFAQKYKHRFDRQKKKREKHEHMNRRKTDNIISKNINTNNYIYIKLS